MKDELEPPACVDARMDEACFAMNFVEDSADSPSSLYRSIAIWSLLNDDETKVKRKNNQKQREE